MEELVHGSALPGLHGGGDCGLRKQQQLELVVELVELYGRGER
jgi:hypothetical protein